MNNPASESDPPPKGAPDLYQKAAEIGKDALDDQVSEMDSMRGRAVQFLAFVGSATAFLVGTTLDGAVVRGWTFGILGVLATLGVLCLLILLRSLLTGTQKWWGRGRMLWHYRMDPTAYTEWLDDQGRRVSPALFYRHLAASYRKQKLDNDPYLEAMRRRYFAFLALGTGELFIWGTLAWLYGKS